MLVNINKQVINGIKIKLIWITTKPHWNSAGTKLYPQALSLLNAKAMMEQCVYRNVEKNLPFVHLEGAESTAGVKECILKFIKIYQLTCDTTNIFLKFNLK